jgi:hypothetical protein
MKLLPGGKCTLPEVTKEERRMDIQWTDDLDSVLAAHQPALLDFTAAPM